MAASYTDLTKIAADPSFQQRVQFAAITSAIAVYNEDPSTTNHVLRARFATQVLGGGLNPLVAAYVVLTNTTIIAEANVNSVPGYGIPDTDIQFQVNSVWNAWAGA